MKVQNATPRPWKNCDQNSLTSERVGITFTILPQAGQRAGLKTTVFIQPPHRGHLMNQSPVALLLNANQWHMPSANAGSAGLFPSVSETAGSSIGVFQGVFGGEFNLDHALKY
jgi:hypothetical protein